MTDSNKPDKLRPTLLQVIGSVLAAVFGVQNEENRKRDFEHGSPWQFIAVGLAVAILFVVGVYGLVKLVLS
jgi:uncharacterized membrane protein YidH (DUF202 family)